MRRFLRLRQASACRDLGEATGGDGRNDARPADRFRVVALVAAHDEEGSIGATVNALFTQERLPDRVVVIADNCSDRTAALARAAGAEVLELTANRHRKSGALNAGFALFGQEADLLVTVDADTVLPPDAVAGWVEEFRHNHLLGGCSAKFTMRLPERGHWARLLTRLQRAEFAKWTDTALHRRDRSTTVLAGTACCLRVSALRDVAGETEREGPWTYGSLVEDFELTYRLRELGWETKVSATVRAYTDAMHTVRSLWAQRMKWQSGTVADLRSFGFNRLTRRDWGQQALGLLAALNRAAYCALLAAALALNHFRFCWWWLLPTLVFIANDIKQARRIPDRDRFDLVLAGSLVGQELFAWMRAGWFFAAWLEVLGGRTKDRWAVQYATEKGER
jgi:poly-beta-1,6-N-acetyl-D-glucosamine synthase